MQKVQSLEFFMDINKLNTLVQAWWQEQQPLTQGAEVTVRISLKQCSASFCKNDLLFKDFLLQMSDPRLHNIFISARPSLFIDGSYDLETCKVSDFVKKVNVQVLHSLYGFGNVSRVRLNKALEKNGFSRVT